YDHWIRARAGAAIRKVRASLDDYRFNEVASEIYAFTWHELCDWYLELSKGTLYNDASPEAQQGARHTLLEVFTALIRLMHPIMPFLTEEIWQRLQPFGTEGTICRAAYPKDDEFPEDDEALAEVALVQEAISAIRRIRSEMELSPRAPFSIRAADTTLLNKHAQALKDLAGIHEIITGGREGICATAVVAGRQLFIPLEGVIDIDAERARLDNQIEKSEKNVTALERRLSSPRYVERAPDHVVQESRDKLAAAKNRVEKLCAARKNLDA
ncbi:MAG: valyl-tRNA synthetase, partial [Myxococcota bacterium]